LLLCPPTASAMGRGLTFSTGYACSRTVPAPVSASASPLPHAHLQSVTSRPSRYDELDVFYCSLSDRGATCVSLHSSAEVLFASPRFLPYCECGGFYRGNVLLYIATPIRLHHPQSPSFFFRVDPSPLRVSMLPPSCDRDPLH